VRSERFGLVHALRGIAASWVVLFHASEGHHIDRLKEAMPAWFHPVFDLGDNGVAIFFALSGFVIVHSLEGDRITPEYIGRFALRRSLRLDPPYWASIAFVLTVGLLSAAVKSEPFEITLAQIIANATYTQLFLNYPSVSTVYWTLCYEVQFYLVLVVSVMLAQRIGVAVYAGLFVAALAWGTGILANPVEGLFLGLWHCFFLGVLAYWAERSRTALVGLLVLSAAVLAFATSEFNITCAMTALGLFAARRTGFITNGLGWRPLMFLGAISYSLYLTHNLVTGASFFVLAKLSVPQWLALPVTLALCLAVAYLFWLLLEAPSMRLAQRIRLRPSGTGERAFGGAPAEMRTPATAPSNKLGQV
jgi:peptidoglycan/LPS O-acetylase OafA/YrhL